MKYQIVKENSIAKMESAVQSLINDGWIPKGGLCADAVGTGTGPYFQAMILQSK